MNRTVIIVLALLLSGCSSSISQVSTPDGLTATQNEEIRSIEPSSFPTDTPQPIDTNTAVPSPSPTSVVAQYQQLAKINHGTAYVDLDFSPDGSRLVVSGSTGLWVYRADDLTLLAKPGIEALSADTSSWSPDGKLLASNTFEHTITIFDMDDGSIVLTQGTDSGLDCPNGFSWSPSGEWIATLCATSGPPIYLWEPSGVTPAIRIDNYFRSGINTLVWSPDGTMLAYSVGQDDRKVVILSIKDQQPVAIMDGDGAMTWSTDGNHLAVIYGEEMLIWNLMEIGKPKLETTFKLDCNLESMEWSPDGSAIAMGCPDGTVLLWDYLSQKIILTLNGNQDRVQKVSWSPDGSKLVSAAFDGSLVLWGNPSLETTSAATELPAETASIVSSITPTPIPPELVFWNFTIPEGDLGVWCQSGGLDNMGQWIDNLAQSILKGSNYGSMNAEVEVEFHNLPSGMEISQEKIFYQYPSPNLINFEFCIELIRPIPVSEYAVQVDMKMHPIDPADLPDATNELFLSFRVLPEINQLTIDDFIVFTSDQVGYPQGTILGDMKLKEHVTNMYAISSDGSKINKLTDLELSQQWSAWSFPSISPDRSRIAAALRTGGNSEGIYLISIESQQQRKLTKSGIYPVWSPDGTMISYYDYALWVINASGSRALQLSDAQEGYPSWSPDSTRLAFVLDNNIWIVNTDGTDLTQLTQNGGSLPSWSPDGLQLAFISGSELWAINSDGSEPHRVASGSFVSEKPNWSPNGDKIAFYDSFAIYIVNNNGTNLFRLTPQQYSPTGSFNWSPDGSQIAFTTAQDIYIVNSDGTELMNLTNNDFSAETFLLWPR